MFLQTALENASLVRKVKFKNLFDHTKGTFANTKICLDYKVLQTEERDKV